MQPQLTPNAVTVLEKRYLLETPQNRLETPLELFERVARTVAQGEKKDRKRWESRFLSMMTSLRFLPNSPTLMNAGRDHGQLSACYVLPIEDSLDSIFETLKNAALIHQSGGGTGFAFSRLRPKGARVEKARGEASGPVSFLRVFDSTTETIKQGGTRRGANMAVLRVDHPDVIEFIESKRDQKSILNFNISLGITSEFMHALAAGGDYSLREPGSLKPIRPLPARRIFDLAVQAAWESGDPGLVFLDRIALFNPTPGIGEMESTNPCGEQPLLPYESCNLGSLNLGKYWNGHHFDWPLYAQDIEWATRFLDNVIDLNVFPVEQSARITRANRKIGLGVMGFADLLLLMNIPYDSDLARQWGEKLMAFLDHGAKASSMQLARERGAFPNWKGSLWERLGYPKMRNATVSTVAPTGTISIIAGASSGIEPLFAAITTRNVLDGAKLTDVHPGVLRAFEQRGVASHGLTEAKVASELSAAWRPAGRVAVMDHVRMQAAFQRHCDSAVSKTINLPENATVADVAKAYRAAYDLGCKGITVYRDKSRKMQVLEPGDGAKFNCETC